MGVFHTICSLYGTLGKMVKGSGIAEIIIESGICASGSLNRVMTGKHYNTALRVHKHLLEALERFLLARFEEDHPCSECLSMDSCIKLMDLIANPNTETASKVKDSEEIRRYFEKYSAFKSELLNGTYGNTALFWSVYMNTIQTILIFIRA